MTSITRTKDGVPGWNGEPSTEYKAAARLYVASTKVELRYTCGLKLAAELGGSARTAIIGQKSSWLQEPQGAEKLLSHLQKVIEEPALPEVGNFMRQYFRVLRRRKGESMTSIVKNTRRCAGLLEGCCESMEEEGFVAPRHQAISARRPATGWKKAV